MATIGTSSHPPLSPSLSREATDDEAQSREDEAASDDDDDDEVALAEDDEDEVWAWGTKPGRGSDEELEPVRASGGSSSSRLMLGGRGRLSPPEPADELREWREPADGVAGMRSKERKEDENLLAGDGMREMES